MPRVTFVPSGRTFELARGGSLFRAILRARLPLARSCRGVGVCALCRVQVLDPSGAVLGAGTQVGSDPTAGTRASPLAPMGAAEAALAARESLPEGQRYACMARVLGDVTITASYW